jgi:hypothetical protein
VILHPDVRKVEVGEAILGVEGNEQRTVADGKVAGHAREYVIPTLSKANGEGTGGAGGALIVPPTRPGPSLRSG